MWMRNERLASWIVLLLLWTATARAEVTARVEGPAGPVSVGQVFQVDILADLSDPVLGWGLDLDFDAGLLVASGAPAIGGDWVPFGGGDGDGLAGVFVPPPGDPGLSGDDVVLATLSFEAVAEGVAALILGITPSDLNEGFALDPTGFDPNVTFVNGLVTIIPEPGTLVLLGPGLVVLAVRRRGCPTRGGPGRSQQG
jgi:hypothetical protein